MPGAPKGTSRAGVGGGYLLRDPSESSPVPGLPKPRFLLSQQPPHLRIASSNRCQWQLGP